MTVETIGLFIQGGIAGIFVLCLFLADRNARPFFTALAGEFKANTAALVALTGKIEAGTAAIIARSDAHTGTLLGKIDVLAVTIGREIETASEKLAEVVRTRISNAAGDITGEMRRGTSGEHPALLADEDEVLQLQPRLALPPQRRRPEPR